jgi:hypothetical protein
MKISLRAAVVLAAALSTACKDVGPPTSAPLMTAPTRGSIPVYAAAAPNRDLRPTGTFDIFDDTAPPARTRYRIEYHNGAVLHGSSVVYVIWYGDWSTNTADQLLLADFLSNLGGRPYFEISRLYPNGAGQAPSGLLAFGGSGADSYSHGTAISDADVEAIVGGRILAGELPLDPSGIYLVLASPDVWQSPGLDVTYCAFHSTGTIVGSAFRYGFIGDPRRSPQRCAPFGAGPNGSLSGDAMVSLMAAELFNIVTDPQGTAWYDRLGLEGADKCAWTYGTTYLAANGRPANVHLGQRDYLLQQFWVPGKNGGACGLTP